MIAAQASAIPLPHVLIASEDDEVCHRIANMLASWRYPYVIVRDGRAALRMLTQDQPPSIAVVDLDLADITGLNVVHSTRQRYEQKRTWLMLLGAQASSRAIQMAAEAGADDFLLKPVEEFDFKVRLRVAERVQSLLHKLQQESEAVKFHSTHDPLTGLLNRDSLLKALFQETDRVQRMKTPLAYVLLDLDSFSTVNLTYGYEVGDKVLQELAGRIRRHLRSYDAAGRYGEDEFLIALPGCSSESILPMTDRMRRSVLDKPFEIGPERFHITASIGVAQSKGRSPLVVLREVERSLAQAKMEGRNCTRGVGEDVELAALTIETNPLLLRMPQLDLKKLN
jgi:two-component system cell cycle response regulator